MANAIQVTRQDVTTLTNEVSSRAESFKATLPSHISFDKFQRIIVTAALQNPKLFECDRQSLLMACNRLATDGLLPDGREAALVPFKARVKVGNDWRDSWQVQAMPMVYGLRKKILQSGEVLSLQVGVVYECEVDKNFIYEIGLEPPIRHRPQMLNVNPEDFVDDKIVAAYSIARIKNGDAEPLWSVELMLRHEINKIRQMSQTGAVGRTDRSNKPIPSKGPWVDWFAEMAKKTVMRRHSKVLPMNSDLIDTFDRDDAEEARADGVGAALSVEGNVLTLPSNESFAGEDGGDNQQSQNAAPSQSDIFIERFNTAANVEDLHEINGDWQESGLGRGDNEDIENAFETACKRLNVDPATGNLIENKAANGAPTKEEVDAQAERERKADDDLQKKQAAAAKEADRIKAQADLEADRKENKVRQDTKAEEEAAARQLDEQAAADPRADAVAMYQGFKSEMEGATNAAQRAAVHEGYAQWIIDIEGTFPDIHEWAMDLVPNYPDAQSEAAAETVAAIDGVVDKVDDNPQEAGIRAVIAQAKAGIAAAKTQTYLNTVMKEVDKHFAIIPEEDGIEIDRLASLKRRELAAKK